MAQQIAQDAVKEAQSVGDFSPIGVTATTNNFITAGDGQVIYNAPTLGIQIDNALLTHTSNFQDSDQRIPNGIVSHQPAEKISQVSNPLDYRV